VNPRQDLCEKVPVRAYPTWVIDGQKYEGVMSLDHLAELTKFRYATPTQAKP
jgi:protein-disulfide isomerase